MSKEEELEQLKRYHQEIWDIYGSELCAGEMIKEEKELQSIPLTHEVQV